MSLEEVLTLLGAFAFGLVLGWITYRTLRRGQTSGISDLTTILGALGGATVVGLFPAGSDDFGAYGIGLAIGFFAYLIKATRLAKQAGTPEQIGEWLGGETFGGSVSGGGRPLPPIGE